MSLLDRPSLLRCWLSDGDLNVVLDDYIGGCHGGRDAELLGREAVALAHLVEQYFDRACRDLAEVADTTLGIEIGKPERANPAIHAGRWGLYPYAVIRAPARDHRIGLVVAAPDAEHPGGAWAGRYRLSI